MKAAQLIKYGGQDAIQVSDDVPKPTPSSGQILVEVHAAGLNPFDWKVREGYMQEFIPIKLPATLGGDVAGIVAEIGENVKGFRVGQEVYGMANAVGGQGSYAEYTLVASSQLAPKPQSINYVESAALPLAAISAYQGIVDHIDLKADQKILIHGGAGGIGALAIQIAKNIGAFVATTVNSKDIDYVKGLGADEVIEYHNQDFSQILEDFDAVFDTVGGATNIKSYDVLKRGGVLVAMNDQANEELVTAHEIIYIQQFSVPTNKRLNKVTELVSKGILSVNIDTVYELDQTAEALEHLKSGHPRGKVVLKVKD